MYKTSNTNCSRSHQASTPSCQPFFPVQLHSLLISGPVSCYAPLSVVIWFHYSASPGCPARRQGGPDRDFLPKNGTDALTFPGDSDIMSKQNLETYRSGRNENDSKWCFTPPLRYPANPHESGDFGSVPVHRIFPVLMEY